MSATPNAHETKIAPIVKNVIVLFEISCTKNFKNSILLTVLVCVVIEPIRQLGQALLLIPLGHVAFDSKL
jgi:hypothetical protein